MRFNDLLIGCWGLCRLVHGADVLGRVKKQTPSTILLIFIPLVLGACYIYSNSWFFSVNVYVCDLCSESRYVCTCMLIYSSIQQSTYPPLQYTHTHAHTGLLQKPSPRQGEQINQLHLCSSNQTRLLSGSSSPTWKGLANQRLL